nr:MAG TPA: hypothetical protein [Caudoviricetes sp.]
MYEMNNECREYAKRIAEEAEAYYNGTAKNADGEAASLYDYFAEALDYEVILTSARTLRAVRLYVTLGGPTCWIDTGTHTVVCCWGGDQMEHPISWDLCDEIEEIVAECMELDR